MQPTATLQTTEFHPIRFSSHVSKRTRNANRSTTVRVRVRAAKRRNLDGTEKRGRMRPLQIAAGALSPAQPALFFRWCYGRRRGRRRRGIGVPRVADDEPLPAALLVDGKVLADFDRSTRLGLDRVGSRFPGKVTA